ncbi:MAG: molybdopterin molybdotransferase MoeA [Acetobacteraceae bacterium]|nr:molybdopterin molybdotransferase MoeA [Acetobacteraceae bacterium]
MTNRIPLPEAQAWIDRHVGVFGPETIDVGSAAGRTSAAALISPVDWPSADCAALDGYALRAAESEGAGDYSPLPFELLETSAARSLPPGSASIALTGLPLPSGADAILPLDAAQRSRTMLDVMAPVAHGTGVDRRGSELRAGTEIVAGSGRLRPQDVALLASLGMGKVAVVRQPRVSVVIPGPKGGAGDALTPMLRALIARDGGIAETSSPAEHGRAALARAVTHAAVGADLVLVAGRSGVGMDDDAPLAIAGAGGTLDVHGIAMRPGDTAGLGHVGGVPMVLLPGAPLACLACYDMLAARAVRRLAGIRGSLPYPVADAVLDRKIVSAIGFTDLVRVRMRGGRAMPLGSAESGGLASAVRANGFVVVPEASEGHALGSAVRVHLYGDPCREVDL